jgi:outer membrane protein TolC
MRLLLFFAVILLSSLGLAALPPDAQAYLNKIPEKKLTLPFVIQTALQEAQAFRMLKYDYASAEIEALQVGSVTDTVLTGGANYVDDNSVKTNPFQPLRARTSEWSLGVAKSWLTGTTTSLRWVQDQNDLEFANLGAFGNSFITQFRQAAAEINLQQNLLKNSFGYATRAKLEAAERRGDSIQWKTRQKLEDTTMAFVDQYYGAWLLQQNVRNLQEQVARQKGLVKVLSGRARKGAIEKPDLIQIETLLATTQTNLFAVRNTLAERWDQLAISLGFPDSFLNVDPMDIPTSIDNPVPLSIRVCGHKEPHKTAEIQALEKALEGLEEDLKAANNMRLPELNLIAGYRGNSIDNRAAQNLQNVLAGRDEDGFGLGPTWNVGLQMKWALSNSEARAQQAQTYINHEKTAAQLQMATDNLRTEWRSLCRQLRSEWENEQRFRAIVSEQQKRVKANDRRFRLGRLDVGSLVDSENDLGAWQFSLHQKRVEVRTLAWRVQQYSGDMYRTLAPMIEPILEGDAL